MPTRTPSRPRARTRKPVLPPAEHASLQEPVRGHTFIGEVIFSLSKEARALLFVIYFLACLLLGLSLVRMILWPESLTLPQEQPAPNAAVQRTLQESSTYIPEI